MTLNRPAGFGDLDRDKITFSIAPHFSYQESDVLQAKILRSRQRILHSQATQWWKDGTLTLRAGGVPALRPNVISHSQDAFSHLPKYTSRRPLGSDGVLGHYPYQGRTLDFIVMDDYQEKRNDENSIRDHLVDAMTGGAEKEAFAVGQWIRVTLEGSSMYGQEGYITGPWGTVPSGGFSGYPTSIKHPSSFVGDGYGWFKTENIEHAVEVIVTDKTVKFVLGKDNNDVVWKGGDAMIKLCFAGVQDFVGLPEGCQEFDAILSADQPEGSNWFEIAPNGDGAIKIRTSRYKRYYPDMDHFLRTLHEDGYRYIRVEV